MSITHLSIHPLRGRGENAAGLKGQLMEHTLAGCDIFTGPNGAGKTSRLLAIVSAVHGIASTPTDPIRPYLESTPTDTGVSLHTPQGTLTRDLSASTRTKAAKEADEEARRLVGHLPVSWDLTDWARATRGERTRILDAIARAGGAIESWGVSRAQHEADLTEAGRWHSLCVQALPGGDDGASWLAAAITWTQEQLLQAGHAARDARGAAAEARVEGARPDGEQEDRRHRDQLIEERAQLRRADTDQAQARQALQQWQMRCDDLEREIAQVTTEGRGLSTTEPQPEEACNPALVQAVDDARAALDECPEPRALHRLTSAHLNALAAVDEARRLLATAEARAYYLDSLGDSAVCVHCQSADPLGVGARLDEARVQAQARKSDAAQAQRDEEAASRALDLAESAQRAHDAAQRDLAVAEAALSAEGPAHERRLQLWRQGEDRREAAIVRLRARYTELSRRLAVVQEPGPPTVPEQQDSSIRLDEIQAELAAVQARETERARWDAAHRASVQAAQRAEAAVQAHEQCRTYLAHLREVRDEMAAKAYQPIQDAARQLMESREGLPVPYFRGPDSYGADCGHGEVPYHDLSESEQVMTAAALVYALAVVSRQPCRLVLLDGLEVVQRSRRALLLGALADAVVAGRVGNVVGTLACDTDEELPEVEGVTYHRLTYEQRRQRRAEPEVPAVAAAAEVEPEAQAPAPIVSAPVSDSECPF